MKFNGWQRIGIVASVVWILGTGFYTLSVDGNRDLSLASGMTLDCENSNNGRDTNGECSKIGETFAMGMLPVEREHAAIVAFIPVPLGWGAAYLLLFLVRWIRRGFVKTN
jgi:hypothetical protein